MEGGREGRKKERRDGERDEGREGRGREMMESFLVEESFTR